MTLLLGIAILSATGWAFIFMGILAVVCIAKIQDRRD
jgi:hypothetical protein